MPLTTEELQNLRTGDSILLGDGAIREVQAILNPDGPREETRVVIKEDWIHPDEIEKVIYKAPAPTATITARHLRRENDKPYARVCLSNHYYYPHAEPESESEPRIAAQITTLTGLTDDEDLIFALANDGTVWTGPARATGGRFSWIQVPAPPQS
jgi:hypothetical protein